MQKHQDFFEEFLGRKSDSFFELPQSGSSRINYIGKYVNKRFIITYNHNLRENEAFFYFSDLFANLDLNTPKILKIDDERMLYIQEFLGNKTLFEIISEEGLSEHVKSLVKQSLQKLFELQTKTLGKIDFSKSFEYENYDNLAVTHDLYYFKNFLIDILEIEYHKSSLLKEFEIISENIQKLIPKTLMVRDFQSRNILVDENDNVFFIDYQSAMLGPATYDVISFLFQAKAGFSEDFKRETLVFYANLWQKEEHQNLENSYNWMKLIRFLQVLGAYGFRGLIQRKKHFLESLSLGIDNIFDLSQNWEIIPENFPELYSVIKSLSSKRKIVN